MKRAVKSADKENTFKLVHKGVYGPQARALAHTLVAAKCSQEYVGGVILAVCKSAGVAVKGKMSRCTVSRAILEGGVAAQGPHPSCLAVTLQLLPHFPPRAKKTNPTVIIIINACHIPCSTPL